MRTYLFYSIFLCSSFAVASDPLSAGTRVPSQQYQSPLKGYQPSAPGTVGSWRQANDVVREVGGWRVYLREAQTEDVRPSETTKAPLVVPPIPQSTAKPAVAPHHQHK